MAEFIDSYINPLSQIHNSSMQDTYDFLNKIKDLIVSDTAFLFTIDINSLYTNNDTQLGLQAVKDTFIKYPDQILEL